jgi:hypothetical protein
MVANLRAKPASKQSKVNKQAKQNPCTIRAGVTFYFTAMPKLRPNERPKLRLRN